MHNGIEEILNYFNKYLIIEKEEEPTSSFIRKIENLIKTIDERHYITDFDLVEALVKKHETSDVDSILIDVMLNLNFYNCYLMNKKIKYVEPNLEKDIEYEIKEIEVEDILKFLGINISDLDRNLVKDLKLYIKKDTFTELASKIKTEDKYRVIYNKITDPNILIAILLHSNEITINRTLDAIGKNSLCLNKLISSIPFILIDDHVNDKCKFGVPCNHKNFINNCKLIKKYSISLERMANFSIFFIQDPVINENNIKKLLEVKVEPKNILEYCGNIFTLNPGLIYENIKLLKLHNIELRDDNNNNGYTILGMQNLDIKIDYLIEQKQWRKNESGLDNMDLIRALIIKDDYLGWQKCLKYDIVIDDLFDNKNLEYEAIPKIYDNYPILNYLDESFLKNDNYLIGDVVISKYRILKNLYNFNGKEDALRKSLFYKTSLSNQILEEVFKTISSIEIGENSVKLS